MLRAAIAHRRNPIAQIHRGGVQTIDLLKQVLNPVDSLLSDLFNIPIQKRKATDTLVKSLGDSRNISRQSFYFLATRSKGAGRRRRPDPRERLNSVDPIHGERRPDPKGRVDSVDPIQGGGSTASTRSKGAGRRRRPDPRGWSMTSIRS